MLGVHRVRHSGISSPYFVKIIYFRNGQVFLIPQLKILHAFLTLVITLSLTCINIVWKYWWILNLNPWHCFDVFELNAYLIATPIFPLWFFTCFYVHCVNCMCLNRWNLYNLIYVNGSQSLVEATSRLVWSSNVCSYNDFIFNYKLTAKWYVTI